LVIGELTMPIDALGSDDPTHLVNISMASALALRMGAEPDGVLSAARAYRPGAHRRTLVGRQNGVTWIDDSKATNPHAALASIRSLEQVVLIAGGLAKGIDVTPLATEPNVRLVLGIGEAGPVLVEAAGERGQLAGDIETAVRLAAASAEPGDTVLLAPGCASFDQFTSYAERGDRFAALALEIMRGERAG
jgi:UDP-N-acetylmuramoylalanine--D-glutamate ligase